jgi:hypothetical protein
MISALYGRLEVELMMGVSSCNTMSQEPSAVRGLAFLTEKRSEGKRSIEDTRRVAEYRVARLGTTSRRGGKPSPPRSTGSARYCGRSSAWR